jgi:hypothetical protein
MVIALVYIGAGASMVFIKSKSTLKSPLNNSLDTIDNDFDTMCTSASGPAHDIDTLYTSGSNVLCTIACPCNADRNDWSQEKHGGFEAAERMETNELGAVELSDCSEDNSDPYTQKHYAAMFKALETSFECAGFCVTPRYFLFSDVD